MRATDASLIYNFKFSSCMQSKRKQVELITIIYFTKCTFFISRYDKVTINTLHFSHTVQNSVCIFTYNMSHFELVTCQGLSNSVWLGVPYWTT